MVQPPAPGADPPTALNGNDCFCSFKDISTDKELTLLDFLSQYNIFF